MGRLRVNMDHTTELEYIRQILDGETRLFAYFLREYGDPVYRLIRKIVESPEESEELTQDVFMRAFKKLSSFKADSRFSTWLYRIAYNVAVSKVRVKKVVYPAVSEEAMSRIPDDESDRLLEGDGHEEQLARLERAVGELPEEERLLLHLYYLEERSVAEIGTIMDLGESNVKIRLHRTRKKLAVMIKYREDE
ncbi:MAG: RNA polymerase sigma factor [Bacteroidota bacterium]